MGLQKRTKRTDKIEARNGQPTDTSIQNTPFSQPNSPENADTIIEKNSTDSESGDIPTKHSSNSK